MPTTFGEALAKLRTFRPQGSAMSRRTVVQGRKQWSGFCGLLPVALPLLGELAALFVEVGVLLLDQRLSMGALLYRLLKAPTHIGELAVLFPGRVTEGSRRPPQ